MYNQYVKPADQVNPLKNLFISGYIYLQPMYTPKLYWTGHSMTQQQANHFGSVALVQDSLAVYHT
jgi:hypothetical protein